MENYEDYFMRKDWEDSIYRQCDAEDMENAEMIDYPDAPICTKCGTQVYVELSEYEMEVIAYCECDGIKNATQFLTTEEIRGYNALGVRVRGQS